MGGSERHQTVRNRTAIDRRGGPRVDVPKGIAVQVRPANVPITLLNVGDGGCLVQAPLDHAVGQTLELCITPAEEEPIVLRARVVRTIRATTLEGVSYICGLEFVDRGSPVCENALESLFSLLREREV